MFIININRYLNIVTTTNFYIVTNSFMLILFFRNQKLIGKINYAFFDHSTSSSRRVVVSTEKNVVAGLNSKTGAISKYELFLESHNLLCATFNDLNYIAQKCTYMMFHTLWFFLNNTYYKLSLTNVSIYRVCKCTFTHYWSTNNNGKLAGVGI